MIQLFLGLLVGVGPSLALYFWLRTFGNHDSAHNQICGKALVAGLLATFPIILFSGMLYLMLRASGLSAHPLLYQAVYTFIVLAFSEELMKYLAFRRFLKKTEYGYSWMELVVLMSIVGLGFGMSESLLYALGSNPVIMLIRGISFPHCGYAAIVGWFYARSVKTGRRGDRVLGFVIAWLNHGLYDFSLAKEFAAANQNLAVAIALILTLLNLAIAIALIVFVAKAKTRER